MKRIRTAVLLIMLILMLFTACNGGKNNFDQDFIAGTDDCCKSSVPETESGTDKNSCCTDDSRSLDEKSENESASDLFIPDCCG